MLIYRMKLQIKRFMQKINGKVHLLHIGKTGGTAVKHVLAQHKQECNYEICLHAHEVKLKDIPEGQKIIFFVRDPVKRFISGFYSRKRQGQPKYFSPWSSDEKIAFEKFTTPNELAEALSSNDIKIKEKAIQAMKNIEHVKSSYWDWFENEEYFNQRRKDIYFIGYQETLSKNFEQLKLKLGLPNSAELPNDEIHAHKNPTNLDKSLSEEAVANLREWYKKDYYFLEVCQKRQLHQ